MPCLPRGGYGRMTTPLGAIGLSFVLFVYAMWKLIFVYILAMTSLLYFKSFNMHSLYILSCKDIHASLTLFVRAHTEKL